VALAWICLNSGAALDAGFYALYTRCMKSTIYPVRLTRQDRLLFKNAAKSEGLSLAEFLRRAGRERAKPIKRQPASLRYLEEFSTPAEAMEDPKGWIRRKIRERHR
jgi:uncharacterized protein (DUF1778 family)